MYKLLLKLNNIQLSALILVSIFITNLLFTLVKYFVFSNKEALRNYPLADTPILYLIVGLVIAPILETMIFQKAAIALSKFFLKNNFISVIISSLLFGLMHFYSFSSILMTSLMGFYFGLHYTILYRKKSKPLLTTAILHSCWNLLSIVGFYLTKLQ